MMTIMTATLMKLIAFIFPCFRRSAPAAAIAAARAASDEMLQATSLLAASAVLSSVSRAGSARAPANVLGQDGGSAVAVIESMSGSSSFVVLGALAGLISAILHAAPLPEDALDRLYRLSIDTVLPAIFAESEQVICCTVAG
jgi:hypothetical protein